MQCFGYGRLVLIRVLQVMKTRISTFGFTIVISLLVAGCGGKGSGKAENDSRTELTAADLAFLTDFHAWKVSIPEAQRPVKAIRLVVVNYREGTVETKFSTGENLETNCSSFLLGIRVEQEKFTGHLLTHTPDGHGGGWNLNLKDTMATNDLGWSFSGGYDWKGNLGVLHMFSKSNQMAVLPDHYSVLATSGRSPESETDLVLVLDK
jgi:hypothetical protein